MNKLLILNKLPWPLRIPVKWTLMGFTVLLVCFPHLSLLSRHVAHWQDPNALIEPDAAALEPLVAELRPLVTEDQTPEQVLKVVEQFVLNKIKYEWDWNTWGNADYLPTVTEAIALGQEDCDGRAVVAASLLRRLGFEAHIVTDFAHVWVKTDRGELMGPRKNKAVVATKEGLSLQRAALTELPKALAYSVSPFPLGRELIIVTVFWWLLLRTHGGWGYGLVALLLLLDGLFLLRIGGQNDQKPLVGIQLLGLLNLAAAAVGLLFWGAPNARATRQPAEIVHGDRQGLT